MKHLFVTALVCLVPACSVFAQTAPPQAAGYQLIFSDAFTNFDLSPNGFGNHTWYPGIYFQPTESYAGPITVNQGVLDFQWDRSSGQNDTSMQGCAFDASHCNTFRYGYFEARMKWDVTNGAWPGFWMITKQGIQGVAHVGELDIFEGQGNDPTHYYGTINEWNGPNDLVTSNSRGFNNQYALAANNDYSQWHNYGVLWVPGKVTWYYDNQPIGTAPTPAIFDQQDFFIVLGSYEGNHWTFGNLEDVTAQTINLDVQWVHAFQLGSPAPPSNSARLSPMSAQVPASVSNGQATLQAALPVNQALALTLTLPIQNQAALDTLLQQISTPGSPNYHQFLTADEFATSYDPTKQNYDAVVNWAASKGLTVTSMSVDRRTLMVSGTVEAINQAFEVTMNSYLDSTNNETFFAPNQEPTLDLTVQLFAITGLTQTTPPLIHLTTPTPVKTPVATPAAPVRPRSHLLK